MGCNKHDLNVSGNVCMCVCEAKILWQACTYLIKEFMSYSPYSEIFLNGSGCK